MTLGQKLKELRTLKGITQKELADELHVSFQTVSKWEKGENEPDIATLKELANKFNCSVDYLIGGEDVSSAPVGATTQEPSKTTIIHQKELHVCARCGKDIPEEELVSEDVTKRERHGRTTRSVTIGQTYYHQACLEEVKEERRIENLKRRKQKAATGAKKSFGWGIAGGVIALAISLIIFIVNRDTVNIGLGIALSILIGYSIFSAVYCIVSGSYIADVFLWCSTLSIKFPGLIFSWDIEGFIWVIGMKILFAVIGFLVGIFALVFAIFLSAALGGISFPFVLIHNNHTFYEDTL